MKKLSAFAFLLLLSTFLHSEEISLYAAASLKNALREIAEDWQKTSPHSIHFNFESSGTLARQISEGAPADIFFSADESKMDFLEKKGLIQNETRKSLLSNQLAIIVPLHSSFKGTDPRDLLALSKIALGETQTVPAGAYAREYLIQKNLWNSLQSKIIPCENVRAVQAAVQSENADAGIVYKTDAMISSSIKIAFLVPCNEGPRISYPIAVVQSAKSKKAAEEFIHFLSTRRASQIFEKYGFPLQKSAVEY
ncbi:MAG: molybdate ABC transporter substrate-binding protein [Verrucomicrobiota bacterium]